MNASERSPLLGVLVASLGGSAGPDWYPRQRGALAGRPLGVRSVCQQGGACVGVRTVASWGSVSVSERARGLGSGGAGPEGVVKRQRSGARSVPWRRALVSTGGGSCGRPCWHVIPLGGVSWWARGVGALPRGAGWVRVAQGLQSQARGGLSER